MSRASNKNLVLTAMVFAVAMTFIDQTIVAIAIPDVQVAFAHSTQTVFYIMAAVMVATFIVSVRGLPRGRVAAPAESEPEPTAAAVEPSAQEA